MVDEGAIREIFMAVAKSDADEVAALLQGDPRLLSSMWKRLTLLTWATCWGSADLVGMLLDRGAEVNGPNAHHNTPLHLAAERGYHHLIQLLLSRGADPSIRGYLGKTPLMYACEPGHAPAAHLLLRRLGARGLDERCEEGRTALWVASFRGQVLMIKDLLLAGADHTIADNAGQTPLQIAQQIGRDPSITLLQWWEGELDRAYALHKARTLHEGTARRQQAPAAPVPAYLSPRVLGGTAIMPSVEMGTRQQEGAGARGAAKRAAEDGMTSYYDHVEVEEEEMAAMVGFVVKDLATELYTELWAGFRL